MATVTVFTAERMLEIEATTVVSGEVEGSNLILNTRGAEGIPSVAIDAGNVRGTELVHHGTNANVTRPDAELVYWIGTATPVNANAWDFHVREDI